MPEAILRNLMHIVQFLTHLRCLYFSTAHNNVHSSILWVIIYKYIKVGQPSEMLSYGQLANHCDNNKFVNQKFLSMNLESIFWINEGIQRAWFMLEIMCNRKICIGIRIVFVIEAQKTVVEATQNKLLQKERIVNHFYMISTLYKSFMQS